MGKLVIFTGTFDIVVTQKGGIPSMNYGMSFREAIDAFESDLNGIEMSAAMELFGDSDTTTAKMSAKTDQANNDLESSARDDVQESSKRVDAIIEKLVKSISRVNNSTLKLLQNTWDDNHKFIAQYSEMAESYKLKDQIDVINWTYGHNMEQYLHAKIVTLRATVTKNAGYLSNWQNIPDDAMIKKGGKELDSAIVGEMGAPGGIDTPTEYMGHLRTQFRGRKSEKSYRGEMASNFIQEIRSFDGTRSSYTQDIQAATRIVKSMQNTVKNQIRNTQFSDDDHRSIIKYLRNMIRMMTIYINMIYFIYRLEVEYILNRRLIINRLYEK